MSALATLERRRGERLVVCWVEFDSGAHGVEIRLERSEQGRWVRRFGLTLKLSELWVVSDGLAKAIELAKGVRR